MNSTHFPRKPVLIVDDEENILNALSRVLKADGINNVICCKDSRLVLDIFTQNKIGVLLLDLTMPYLSGEELLPLIRLDYPDIPIIIITGMNEVSTAVECMRMGAFDYLVKAIENSKLITSVRRAIEILELREDYKDLKKHFFSNKLECPEAFSGLITNNEKMHSLFLYVESISKSNQTVNITGETGVGKEMIAQIIHKLSRKNGEFIEVNVAGLDDHMFSDTLFGHKKGAFTSASEPRTGLIGKASGGTLFLDEIGDLNATSQVKLLRLLEAKEYFPLGSDLAKTSDARIIVATNKKLNDLISTGKFRKDLYYRLSTHEVEIPPLKSRKDDLPLLIDFFLDMASHEMGKKRPTPPPELFSLLETYDFPGNIRELKSMIFDAVSMHKRGILSLTSFKAATGKNKIPTSLVGDNFHIIFGNRLPTLKITTELLIKEAIKRSKGNQALAAHLLGISSAALSKRLTRGRDRYK